MPTSTLWPLLEFYMNLCCWETECLIFTQLYSRTAQLVYNVPFSIYLESEEVNRLSVSCGETKIEPMPQTSKH